MNKREKNIIEERLISAERAYRVEHKLRGGTDRITIGACHASVALSRLYQELFGLEELTKLMEKNFPEMFKN